MIEVDLQATTNSLVIAVDPTVIVTYNRPIMTVVQCSEWFITACSWNNLLTDTSSSLDIGMDKGEELLIKVMSFDEVSF